MRLLSWLVIKLYCHINTWAEDNVYTSKHVGAAHETNKFVQIVHWLVYYKYI
jgi:hypothetical protein